MRTAATILSADTRVAPSPRTIAQPIGSPEPNVPPAAPLPADQIKIESHARHVGGSPLDALNRARAAWETTQPQLTIPSFWDALEEVDVARAATEWAAAASISSSACVDGSGPDVPPPGPSQDHALDLGADQEVGGDARVPGSIPGSSTPAEEAANPSRSDDRGAGYATTEPSASAGDSPPLHGPPAPTPSRRARTGRRR